MFIPWCAGVGRHERLARKHVPDYDPGWWDAALGVPAFPGPYTRHSGLPIRHSREGGNPEGRGWAAMFIPWCAGMSDWEARNRPNPRLNWN